MIKQLMAHISQEQVNSIVNTIICQYFKYRKLIDSLDFKEVFLEEYTPHNKQFGLSWAISSAFPSQSTIDDTLHVSCYIYSKNFTRPLLSSESIKLMVLNKTTHFKADYLSDFYKMNENNFQGKQLFCYIKFSVDNKQLTKISLCLPDQNGDVIEEEVLLGRKQIQIRVAA